MTNEKSTGSKGPHQASDSTEYQLGLVTKTVSNFPKKDASPEVVFAFIHAKTDKGRIEKLRQQISDMQLERFLDDENDLRHAQFHGELAEIERLFADGSLRALLKSDPLKHALRALERLVGIAGTEEYFETLVRYNLAAEGRRTALQKNIAENAHFRPGSAEERDLVARFRRYADDKKPIRNIPKMIHNAVANLDDAPSLMTIRRALQRLELIPKPKPRKQK